MGIDQKSIDEFEQKEQEAVFNLIYENIAKIEELIGLLEKDHLISQKKDVSNFK